MACFSWSGIYGRVNCSETRETATTEILSWSIHYKSNPAVLTSEQNGVNRAYNSGDTYMCSASHYNAVLQLDENRFQFLGISRPQM